METEDWEIYLFYRLEKGKIPRKENMQKNDHKKQRRIRREQWCRYQRWKKKQFQEWQSDFCYRLYIEHIHKLLTHFDFD